MRHWSVRGVLLFSIMVHSQIFSYIGSVGEIKAEENQQISKQELTELLERSNTDDARENREVLKHPVFQMPQNYQQLLAEIAKTPGASRNAAIVSLALLQSERCDPAVSRDAARHVLREFAVKRRVVGDTEVLVIAAVELIGERGDSSDAATLVTVLGVKDEKRKYRISQDFWICIILDAIGKCGAEDISAKLEKTVEEIAKDISSERLCRMKFISRGFVASAQIRERAMMRRLGVKCENPTIAR